MLKGKDRTGIIAPTLLGLMGVEHRDIINDYQQSYINIKDRFQTMDPELNHRYMNLMKSEPEAIEQFPHAIHDRYGSFVSYLSTVGVDVTVQDQIVKKFTSK
ncbi:tyrosine-protein phosphatase [Erysipelothrix sp. D19-032]